MARSSKEVARQAFESARRRVHGFKSRRPHRSFRLTRRRDYRRSLKLPGYLTFTVEVNRTLRKYRKTFLLLGVFYALGSAILVGLASQDIYSTLTGVLRDTGSDIFQGNTAELGKAGLLLLTIVTSGLSANDVDNGTQIMAALLIILAWLTTVWLLRNFLAGHAVRLRDGLYNAGAPLIPMILMSTILILQAIPIALAVIGYNAATATGLLSSGVEAMLFWIAASLLAALSLYWVISTFMAMIIVSLPGMYPMRALRLAGDLVVGRRIRILLRLLWMTLCVVLGSVLFLLPVILFDSWLKGVAPAIEWLPIIPVALLINATVIVIWMSSYIYLLYRKVVDDDAKPA